MTTLVEFSVAVGVGGDWHVPLPFHDDSGAVGSPFVGFCVEAGPLRRVRIARADGASFLPERVKVSIRMPLLNYAHVVVPDCGRHYVNFSKGLDIRLPLFQSTAANAGHPFLAVADEGGGFLAAFGVVSRTGEVDVRRVKPRISQRKAMVGGDQHLSHDIVWSVRGGPVRELEVVLYSQERAATWFHALREYAQAIQAAEGVVQPASEDAWRPTWCTWTAFCSSEMTDRRVLENARVARDLGIGTVILDDGWFGVGLDDDGGGALNLGDYHAAPAKFPDLRRHVEQLHELGLKVLLWHAPLCVAPESQAYAKLRPYLMQRSGKTHLSVNGLSTICPACPEVRRYVVDETVRLMRETGVDGLKVDLFNCLPSVSCDSTEHAHDIADPVEALEAVMSAQWDAMRSVRPDAICELKQDYGNARLAKYGTMVRAGDTAYDLDTNCRRCFYTQAVASCVHNDYYVTSDLTSPLGVSLAMARMLAAGVPTFGMDLVAFPRPLRLVIAEWMAFYNAHRAMFQAPREPQANDLSCWQGGDAHTAWVAPIWQCREIRLPEADRIFVLNGTAHRDFHLRLPASREVDVRVQTLPGGASAFARQTLVDGCRLAVPPGGVAEIAAVPRTAVNAAAAESEGAARAGRRRAVGTLS